MPLIDTKDMLLKAQKGNYAVCAFNAENLEMVQAIVRGAEEMSAPVIVQTTPSTVRYTDVEYFFAAVSTAAKNATVPVALHLDHGDSFELVCRAIRAGYTSVMIDGSHAAFEDNIAITKKVVELAKNVAVPVEGELGQVGGKEDDLEAGEGAYTNPKDAVEFVERTGVDSLAVGIGTAHGFYAVKPVLDLDRLSEISGLVSIPIVLHGATGLSDDVIIECIKRGICKVNFATELRAAYTNAVRETLENDKAIVDVKIYSKNARQKVMELVKKKISVSGSFGKA